MKISIFLQLCTFWYLLINLSNCFELRAKHLSRTKKICTRWKTWQSDLQEIMQAWLNILPIHTSTFNIILLSYQVIIKDCSTCINMIMRHYFIRIIKFDTRKHTSIVLNINDNRYKPNRIFYLYHFSLVMSCYATTYAMFVEVPYHIKRWSWARSVKLHL